MATETTSTSAAAWRPDLTAVAPVDAIPDAIILQASTVAGEVEGDAPSVRVQYIDDASADFVAEGAAIPEADPDLAEVVVHTAKLSQLVRLSREQWVQPGTENQLSDSVARAITKRANQAFLTQVAPTSPAVAPPAGLINITGVVNGGAVADDLDALIDLVATLEANGAEPSHIICSPTAWASLRKFKTGTDYASSLLGAGTSNTERRLLDLPVLVTPAMTSGSGMVLDQASIVSAVGDVLVSQSEHAYFNSDSIGLRATWRIGWNAVRPNRLGRFTVTAPA